MTVTFLQNGCDVTPDQSFDWPDAADVVSSLVFVHVCVYVYVCVCVWEREREREREGKKEIITLIFI